MANNFSKTAIPIAAGNKTKLDLSCDHITTMDFMKLQPVFYRHMIKGEHLNFDVFANIRLAPLQLPTYGKIRCNLRGFWIPYRLAMPLWHEFYNDTIGSSASASSLVASPPILSNTGLVEYFFTPTYGQSVVISDPNFNAATDPYDFEMGNVYYNLTKSGRDHYKILYSLGYDVVGTAKNTTFKFNALALLALCKAYIDWYANSQYLDSVNVTGLKQLLAYNNPSSPLVLDDRNLDVIFTFIDEVLYSSNPYFELAWDNPVAPNPGNFTSFTFFDATSSSIPSDTYVMQSGNGTPFMRQGVATSVNIGTSNIHQMLDRLTAFQHRHALSGARSIDRVLAQYGITTDYLKEMRSIYVGSQSIDIDTGAVMATANGTNSAGSSSVGDYAGVGFGKGSKSWDFSCDEEGIFIVLASILPSGGYYQGYDANNRHIEKTTFFVPEFDSLSVQAVEKGEVYVSRNDSFNMGDPANYTNSFGYVGRYGEYKRSISRVSGDIAMPSVMQGGDAWHLMRTFKDIYFGGAVANLGHGLGFTQGDDAGQYHRIFQYVGDDVDPFYCFFHFDVGSYAPCKPLFETFDFGDAAGNQKVTIDSGGSKLN